MEVSQMARLVLLNFSGLLSIEHGRLHLADEPRGEGISWRLKRHNELGIM